MSQNRFINLVEDCHEDNMSPCGHMWNRHEDCDICSTEPQWYQPEYAYSENVTEWIIVRVLGQKTNITHLLRWHCTAREVPLHDENGLKLLLASYPIHRGPYTGWLKAHEGNLSQPQITLAMAFQSNCKIEKKWRKLHDTNQLPSWTTCNLLLSFF